MNTKARLAMALLSKDTALADVLAMPDADLKWLLSGLEESIAQFRQDVCNAKSTPTPESNTLRSRLKEGVTRSFGSPDGGTSTPHDIDKVIDAWEEVPYWH